MKELNYQIVKIQDYFQERNLKGHICFEDRKKSLNPSKHLHILVEDLDPLKRDKLASEIKEKIDKNFGYEILVSGYDPKHDFHCFDLTLESDILRFCGLKR